MSDRQSVSKKYNELIESRFPVPDWQILSTTGHSTRQLSKIQITHPFHPQVGKTFKYIDKRYTWGQTRVYYEDDQGDQRSVPIGFTDALPPDLFVMVVWSKKLIRQSLLTPWYRLHLLETNHCFYQSSLFSLGLNFMKPGVRRSKVPSGSQIQVFFVC